MATKTMILNLSEAQALKSLCEEGYDASGTMQEAGYEAAAFNKRWLGFAAIFADVPIGMVVWCICEFYTPKLFKAVEAETVAQIASAANSMGTNGYLKIQVDMTYDVVSKNTPEGWYDIPLAKKFRLTGIQDKYGTWHYVM